MEQKNNNSVIIIVASLIACLCVCAIATAGGAFALMAPLRGLGNDIETSVAEITDVFVTDEPDEPTEAVRGPDVRGPAADAQGNAVRPLLLPPPRPQGPLHGEGHGRPGPRDLAPGQGGEAVRCERFRFTMSERQCILRQRRGRAYASALPPGSSRG